MSAVGNSRAVAGRVMQELASRPRVALTPVQVAERYGLHPSTVRRLIGSGELPATRWGRDYRIDPADLAAYVEAHRTTAQPAPRRRRRSA